MCFSATASFTASVALGALGIATISQAKEDRELPLAFVPIFFALQQGLEGLVWTSLDKPFVNFCATKSYLFFAYAFWPAYMAWSVWLVEKSDFRKRFMKWLMLAGIPLGLYGLYYAELFRTIPTVSAHQLSYNVPIFFPLFAPIYVYVLCVSCLLSTNKWLSGLGMALFVSLVLALTIFSEGSASSWCFFSALLSLIIFFYFRSVRVSRKG